VKQIQHIFVLLRLDYNVLRAGHIYICQYAAATATWRSYTVYRDQRQPGVGEDSHQLHVDRSPTEPNVIVDEEQGRC